MAGEGGVGCEIVETGRAAGLIVAAIEHNAAGLTSDPKDLATLASAADYPVRLLTV